MKKIFIILIIGLLPLSCWCNKKNPASSEEPTSTSFKEEKSPVTNSIYLTQDSTSGLEITLGINAKEVSNIYGASFSIEYDPNIINYVSNSGAEGDFFSYDGVKTTGLNVLLENGIESCLVIGIGRRRDSSELGRTGSGKIGQIKFRAKTKGKTSIKFINNNLRDFQKNSITCTWIGGEITGAE